MTDDKTTEGTPGRKSPENRPEALAVVTGAPDDRRIDLPPGHALYALAAAMREHQATLSDAEHGALWAGLLPLWPRRGPRATSDGLAAVAARARLALGGFDDGELAELLCVDPDTIRRRSPFVRALELASTSALDTTLGTAHERAAEQAVRGPWVFATSEPAPAFVVPFGLDDDPVVVQCARARVDERVASMARAGELVHVGALHCRVVDGRPDVERALEALRWHFSASMDCDEDVEATIAGIRADVAGERPRPFAAAFL